MDKTFSFVFPDAAEKLVKGYLSYFAAASVKTNNRVYT
jgi:hypothetical protein